MFELVWNKNIQRGFSVDSDFIFGVSAANDKLYKMKLRKKLRMRNQEELVNGEKLEEMLVHNGLIWGIKKGTKKVIRAREAEGIGAQWEELQNFECLKSLRRKDRDDSAGGTSHSFICIGDQGKVKSRSLDEAESGIGKLTTNYPLRFDGGNVLARHDEQKISFFDMTEWKLTHVEVSTIIDFDIWNKRLLIATKNTLGKTGLSVVRRDDFTGIPF